MNPTTLWWLEHTPSGRRVQRQMLPESALMPRARAEARDEREEREQREHEAQCRLVAGHDGDHVYPARGEAPGPPSRRPRCRAWRRR